MSGSFSAVTIAPAPPSKVELAAAFRSVDTWIFDLDNTLYPATCDLFAEIEVRMGVFISQFLGVSQPEAHVLRQSYYREHGTTLRGLMACHGVDPRLFLNFVHDVDVTIVPPNPALDRLLGRLPGRKVIFTNGDARYAARVLDRLGIAAHFELIFDIEAANFVPKPAPQTLDALLNRLAAPPARAVMFDDIAANLAPAHARGLATVWVKPDRDFSPRTTPHGPDHPHHVTDDLTQFLAGTVFLQER